MLDIDELKSWLKVEGSDHDSDLRSLERRAVAFLEGETGRYLRKKAQTTDIVDGTGTPRLWLSDPPSTDPTEVEEVPDPGDDPTTITAADEDGFEVRGALLVRKDGCVWTRDYEYRVTYERGFTAAASDDDHLTDAPEVARQAVFDLVALKWRGRGKEETESESISGYSYRRADIDGLPGLEDAITQLRLDWL